MRGSVHLLIGRVPLDSHSCDARQMTRYGAPKSLLRQQDGVALAE